MPHNCGILLNHMEYILASASPRRRQLLAQITEFEVEPSSFEERAVGLSARETALAFARGKALDVFLKHPDCLVLGADTVVCLNGEIFGKPKDAEDAKRMLRLLSGKTHSVFTGVCLMREGAAAEGADETKVSFLQLNDEAIEAYVASGLPFGKAGAYGIQDGGLVEKIEGSYSNVVGLPVELTKELFRKVSEEL